MPERFVEPFIEHQGERRALWLRKPRPAGKRLLLAPAGTPAPDRPAGDRIVIALAFERAFGTGGHGTTEGCLVALEERIRGGETMLDAGSGTGILSIAAAKIGARRVTAVDISRGACDETRANVRLNGVCHVVEVIEGGVEAAAGRFDVVVANLRTPILVRIMPDLVAKAETGGTAILSGILVRELPSFLSFLRQYPLEVADTMTIAGWVTLTALRAGS